MVRQGILGRRTADGFYNFFILYLRFLIQFIRTTVLRGNRQKMPEICGDMVGNRTRGCPCFIGLRPVGNVPVRFLFSLGFSQSLYITLYACKKCIQYPSGISQRVANTLRYCINGVQELQTHVLAQFWAFPLHFP